MVLLIGCISRLQSKVVLAIKDRLYKGHKSDDTTDIILFTLPTCNKYAVDDLKSSCENYGKSLYINV